jgi:hypothetical protein
VIFGQRLPIGDLIAVLDLEAEQIVKLVSCSKEK